MGLKASDKECVGYLCVDRKGHREIVKEPIGTCFFVCFPSVACSDHQSLYLVTAKHVIENEPVVYVRNNNKLNKKAE